MMRQTTGILLFLLAALLFVMSCKDDRAEAIREQERRAAEQLYRTDHLSPEVLMQRMLRGLYDSAFAYYQSDRGDIPRQFPQSAPRTPATVPCRDGVEPNPADWEHPTWRALRFLPTDRLHFSYEFRSQGTGSGSTFTIFAYGDRDCDGELSTFYRGGTSYGWNGVRGDTETRIIDENE